MSAEWQNCIAFEIAAPIKNALVGGPFGSNLVSKDYVDFGVPVIRGQNMCLGRWVTGDFVYVSTDKAETLSANIARPGDIIFTQRGTLGQVAIVPDKPHEKYIVSQSQMKLTVDGSKVDALFLYYVFTSPKQLQYIRTNAIQVGVPHTNLGILKGTPLYLPPLDKQFEIATVLSLIDDKIELNRRINQTLEEMAQAIFKSWFVDFEPVRAKIEARENGRDPERAAMSAISGKTEAELKNLPPDQLIQLATTAALFPDELVESELGMIPEGWEVSNIEKEFDVTMGQSPPGHTYNENGEGVPFFQGRRDFRWRYPVNRIYCTAPKRFAKTGDTLLSVRAPVGDVNKAMVDCCIGRGLAALRHKSGCEAYTYNIIKELEQHFNNYDTEGTVFGAINQKGLKAIKIIKPENKILKEFSKITGILDQYILNFERQVSNLTQLRDTLLPKLLSGEITIANTQAKIEDAV